MSIRTYFENIADAIREKDTSVTTLTPEEMPNAIRNISGGGGFVPSEYSEYLNSLIDTGIAINTGNTVEVAFYTNAYQNDGHIIGNMTQSSGNGFHLTTYSNRWYGSNGSSEYNFSANSETYPLYGKDIIYRLTPDGKVYLNGVNVVTSNMGTQGSRYALNTRGGSVSTQGKYRYKYMKIWNSNNELIFDLSFGSLMDGALKVGYDSVSEHYIIYS